MSSYIDHYRLPQAGEKGWAIDVSWREVANARLRWLYGDEHVITRRAATQADIAAWNRLGSGRAAA